MIEIIIEKAKQNWEFISAVFLWLFVWATYDTDISRFFAPGFPHNALDLIHGLRSLLPFLALTISIIILIKKHSLSKKIFLTPLGLLGIFTIVGIFSSVFSKNPLSALYWGILYGIVIIVLLTIIENKDLLRKIIIINLIIAGILAVGLALFFFIQPGAVKSLTFNFLICSSRPYEGLGGVAVAVQTFGVAGTRPTGLGRYAGFVAIAALAGFLCAPKKTKNKITRLFLFILFLFILLFSKGKTEIIAFIIAMIFVVWLSKKINIFSVLAVCLVFIVSIFIIFYNVPCANSINFITSTVSQFFAAKNVAKPATGNVPNVLISEPKPVSPPPAIVKPVSPPPAIVKPVSPSPIIVKPVSPSPIIVKPVSPPPVIVKPVSPPPAIALRTNVATLSGRTNGVWTNAWRLFLKNPLVGFGFQADRFFLAGQHAHSSIIHALVQAGILGTVPFIFAFILTLIILLRLFRNSKIAEKERNFLIMISSVLIFFAIRSITESVAFFSADWLFVAPIIAYIQCLDNKLNYNNSKNPVFNFLGNKINAMRISDVIEKMNYWIKNEPQKIHWIVVTGMHGIVEAEKHSYIKHIISSADLFAPDGISLVWLLEFNGFDIKKRVSGADLMQEFFKNANGKGFSSYFYGDTDETLQALRKKLSENFSNLKIAGTYSPPFRDLAIEENEKIIEKINQAKPDVLWVGLGLPKQEKWIFEHRGKLNVPVVIGVGAAFKFLSGKVERAPAWVGNFGFEWLWRLFKEPKTTWRRVFLDMPFFIWLIFLELASFKRYKEYK